MLFVKNEEAEGLCFCTLDKCYLHLWGEKGCMSTMGLRCYCQALGHSIHTGMLTFLCLAFLRRVPSH